MTVYNQTALPSASSMRPADPNDAIRRLESRGVNVRGEWNPALPDERRMWAIAAADYGRMVRGFVNGRHGFRPDTPADVLAVQLDRSFLLFTGHARTAVTCARWATGDTDERPRTFNDLTDAVALAMMRRFDARERARKTRRFGLTWPEWFIRARGVLWAHVPPCDLEPGDPAALQESAGEYPERGHAYFGVRREYAGAPGSLFVDYWHPAAGVRMPGGKPRRALTLLLAFDRRAPGFPWWW